MLKTFAVSNFRSIKEKVELSFEPLEEFNEEKEFYLTSTNLLKLALIYGPNASGKTNIIRALSFLRDFIFHPPKDKNQEINIAPFAFIDKSLPYTSFFIEFLIGEYTYSYTLIFNKKHICFEEIKFKSNKKTKERFKYIFRREKDNWRWNERHVSLKEQEKELLKISTIPNISILSGYSRVNITIQHFENIISFFKKILPPIFPDTSLLGFILKKIEKKEINESEIVSLLQNADFSIDNFSINEQEPDDKFLEFLKKIGEDSDPNNWKKIEIFFQHFQKYQLPFEEESEGTKRFYQLAAFLTLLAKNAYIVPIDEIESSLHPELVKYFLYIFLTQSSNSQLILTTHMRELLTEKELLRPDAIWFCDKKENGSTELYSFADFDNIENRSFYQLYKFGQVGALPNIRYFKDIAHGKEKTKT